MDAPLNKEMATLSFILRQLAKALVHPYPDEAEAKTVYNDVKADMRKLLI